ncbi:MAG: S-layer homology domain-containing protein [Nitrospirota bacterium]
MRQTRFDRAVILVIGVVLLTTALFSFVGCNTESDDLKTSILIAQETTDSGDDLVNSDGTEDNWEDIWDDWTDEENCEYYEKDGQACETCYGSDGNITWEYCGEKVDDGDINNDTWIDDTGTDDTWIDDTGTDDNMNNNIADSKDVEKQKKDMEKNMGEQMEKEWERLVKRQERTKKSLEKIKKGAEKEIDRMDEDESTEEFEEIIAGIDKSVSNIEGQITETKETLEKLNDVQEAAAPCVSSLNPGTTTWQELQEAWDCTRKVEVFRVLRDAMDMRAQIEENQQGSWEMKFEIAKFYREMETVSSEIKEKLDSLLSTIDGFSDYRAGGKDLYETALTEVNTILAMTDPEEIRDAVDDIWWGISEDIMDYREDMQLEMEDFWWDDPWMTIQEARDTSHTMKFVEEIKREIEMISGELEKAGDVVDALEGLNIEKEQVKKAIENFSELVGKATGVLEEMKSKLDEPELEPEDMEDYWYVMDNVGETANKALDKIFKYFEKNQNKYDELSSDVRNLLEQWRFGIGGKKDYGNEFGKIYSELDVDELTRKIKAEIMEEVMRNISEELMEKLAPYLDEDVIAGLLNNIGALGDVGNELLSNTADTYAEIEESGLTPELQELAEKTKNSLIVSSIKDHLIEKWEEVRLALEVGDYDSLDLLADKIKNILEENEQLSVTGEEAYTFYDTPVSEWYFGSVYTMKEEGIVSGYSGDQAGNFGPGNSVTIAEALKMSLEAAGHYMNAGSGGHWAEAAGYVSKAKDLGIGDLISLSNLDKFATREEVAVIIAMAFDFDTDVEYENAFSDYHGQFGGHVQAVYENEIFTGEGDTKSFNGSGLINRAAMSKVIDFALEAQQSDNFIDELDDIAVDFGVTN